MLLLTRRVGQEIIIGNEIRVIVLAINGTVVKLGIDAPKDVPVNRKEVEDRERP